MKNLGHCLKDYIIFNLIHRTDQGIASIQYPLQRFSMIEEAARREIRARDPGKTKVATENRDYSTYVHYCSVDRYLASLEIF